MFKEKIKRRIRKVTAFAAAVAMVVSIMFTDGTFGGFGITVSADDYGNFGVNNSL